MKFRLIIDSSQEEEVVAMVHQPSALTDQLETLILAYTGENTVCGYSEEEWKLLPYSEIECITVLAGKVYAIDKTGRQYRLKQRLYELEAQLPGYFIRINKSALANKNRLERFSATYSGGVDAIFKCGFREYVSRRCFAQIKRRLEGK